MLLTGDAHSDDGSIEDGSGAGSAAKDAADIAGSERKKETTPAQVFFNAPDRMQRMAIQPLDLRPPVEVICRDFRPGRRAHSSWCTISLDRHV